MSYLHHHTIYKHIKSRLSYVLKGFMFHGSSLFLSYWASILRDQSIQCVVTDLTSKGSWSQVFIAVDLWRLPNNPPCYLLCKQNQWCMMDGAFNVAQTLWSDRYSSLLDSSGPSGFRAVSPCQHHRSIKARERRSIRMKTSQLQPYFLSCLRLN